MIYTPWTNSTFKAIYGQAYRAPNAYELDYEAPGYATNPNLQPETSRAYLINSIDGIVWECEPESLRFTFVSRQSERLLGYSPQDWLADPGFWQKHLLPEDAARAVQLCHDHISRGLPYSFEYRMLSADGRAVWIRESGGCWSRTADRRLCGASSSISQSKKSQRSRSGAAVS